MAHKHGTGRSYFKKINRMPKDLPHRFTNRQAFMFDTEHPDYEGLKADHNLKDSYVLIPRMREYPGEIYHVFRKVGDANVYSVPIAREPDSTVPHVFIVHPTDRYKELHIEDIGRRKKLLRIHWKILNRLNLQIQPNISERELRLSKEPMHDLKRRLEGTLAHSKFWFPKKPGNEEQSKPPIEKLKRGTKADQTYLFGETSDTVHKPKKKKKRKQDSGPRPGRSEKPVTKTKK